MSLKRTSVSIKSEVVERIDEIVKKGHFRNRSHAFEEGLKKLIAEQES